MAKSGSLRKSRALSTVGRRLAQSSAESSGNLHGERDPISHVRNVSTLANYSTTVPASFCVRISFDGLKYAVFVWLGNSDAAMAS